MRKLFLALAAPLALMGCAGVPVPGTALSPPPAPLASTAIDEKALLIGWQAFDVALVAIDGLLATGRVQPGSATAQAIDTAIGKVQAALNAAQAARGALSASNYATAMAEAQAGFSQLQALLKGAAK